MARILIIDDDEQLRRFMAAVLASWGYWTDVAADGDAGLASYRLHPADLVFCDMQLDGKNGIETVAAMAAEFPTVKVVMMSGLHLGDRPKPPATFPPAVVGCIQKPFLLPELSEIVRRILG